MRAVIVCFVLVSACSSMPPVPPLPMAPVVIPQPVTSPVPIPCQIPKPERIPGDSEADFPDSAPALKQAYGPEMDWTKVINLLARGWPLRDDYIVRLENAFSSCTKKD